MIAQRKFHVDGSAPQDRQVFVFGSNLDGAHHGGAARAAHDKYGAQWGVAIGPTGDSYAIPTVAHGLAGAISLEDIRSHVREFIGYAHHHRDQQFFVTRIGCGIAGHRDADIAPMFADAPANCSLPDAWTWFL